MREDAARAGAALAHVLKQGRTEADMTQDDVVAGTGVSKRTYIRWEQGELDLVTLLLIAEVCRFQGVNPLKAALALGFVTTDEVYADDDPLLKDLRRVLNSGGQADGVSDTVRRLVRLALRLSDVSQSAAAGEVVDPLLRALSAALDLAEATVTARGDIRSGGNE